MLYKNCCITVQLGEDMSKFMIDRGEAKLQFVCRRIRFVFPLRGGEEFDL